ncbi:MAG: TAXI family TRAP transporter solute-binding subunit [candidate division NC10 bacterium]
MRHLYTRLFLIAVFGLWLFLPSDWVHAQSTQTPLALSLGTSSVGARFHILAVGMGAVITRHSNLAITVEPIGGSDANVRTLATRRIEMALLNSLAATHGFRGTGPFAKEGKVPLRLVFQGGLSARALVARADRGILTGAYLRGKAVQARRKALADLEVLFKAILKVHNIPETAVKILSHSNTKQQVESLRLGTADAAVVPFGSPKTSSPPLRRLAGSVPLVVIGIPPSEAREILKTPFLSGYRRATIYKGALKGLNQDVPGLAVGTYTVARADLPEAVVYRFTKAFFEHLKEFYPVHASARQYTLKGSLSSPTVPYHAGAVRYYKEIGRWTPELQQLQTDLLK